MIGDITFTISDSALQVLGGIAAMVATMIFRQWNKKRKCKNETKRNPYIR
jgi:hypothetical protein